MKLKKIFIKIRAVFLRIGLKNRSFTIISNNCWGGIVSRDRNLPYNSPTAGLFFFSNDYIKFLGNMKHYFEIDMKQISIFESKYSNYLLQKYDENLIIGDLDGVELIMLHYKTFEEAKTKWDRRKKRVNYENILIKFSDQNLFEEKDFVAFKNINYKNKLFITTNDKYRSDFTCVLKDLWGIGYAKDDIKPSFKILNVNKILNNMTIEKI